MAKETKEDCTFKRTGVCNCDRETSEDVAGLTSQQSSEEIKGIAKK